MTEDVMRARCECGGLVAYDGESARCEVCGGGFDLPSIVEQGYSPVLMSAGRLGLRRTSGEE